MPIYIAVEAWVDGQKTHSLLVEDWKLRGKPNRWFDAKTEYEAIYNSSLQEEEIGRSITLHQQHNGSSVKIRMASLTEEAVLKRGVDWRRSCFMRCANDSLAV